MIILRDCVEEAVFSALDVWNINQTLDFFTLLTGATAKCLDDHESEYRIPIVFCIYDIDLELKSDPKILLIEPEKPEFDKLIVHKNDVGKLFSFDSTFYDDYFDYLKSILEQVVKLEPDFMCFPELTSVNDDKIDELLLNYSQDNKCVIIYGSYHDILNESNISKIYLPNKEIVKQDKIFRAEEQSEGIINKRRVKQLNIIKLKNYVFCVLICIDNEREMIKKILKERYTRGIQVDMIFNPSLTSKDRAYAMLHELNNELSCISVFSNHRISGGGSAILAPIESTNKNKFILHLLSGSPMSCFTITSDTMELLRSGRPSDALLASRK